MKIGLHLPQVGPLATREGLTAIARLAEERDFDSLWVSDHVIIPRKLTSRYPYSPDGSFPMPPDIPFLEPLAALLFVAAVTQKAKLGTTILVVPMRNPVITAKQLSSLDVLSNGRLILGAGAGWMAEEFEMLEVPFEHRGPRLDDYIQLIRALWTEENPSFNGRYYKIADVGFSPKPIQKPHPPIWIGGHSKPALRRAGRFADAWHAAYVGPELLKQQFAQVREYAEQAGRDPKSIELTVRTRLPLNHVDQAIAQIEACRAIGVTHLVTEALTADMDRTRSMMDTLANEVLPRARA